MTNELIEELEEVYRNLDAILRYSTLESMAYFYRCELEKNTTELKRIIEKINREID